jgi:hypothetical protein
MRLGSLLIVILFAIACRDDDSRRPLPDAATPSGSVSANKTPSKQVPRGARNSSAARDAARDRPVGAERRLPGGAVDDAALRSRRAVWTREGAGRTRFALDVAVVVGADEVAVTVGSAPAGPVRARSGAPGVVALAIHVARRLRAAKVAASSAAAAAFAVRARPAARIAVAVDVTGRRLARKIAVAPRPAGALAVATRSPARIVVALAIDVTGRLVALEFARRARLANARAVVAVVVVTTRNGERHHEKR